MKPLFLLGEAWGQNEARVGLSFVGAAGIELLRMLDEAGVVTLTAEDHSYLSRFWQSSDPRYVDMVWKMHPEVHRSNVFNLHPPSNDILAFCGTKASGLPWYPPLTKSKYVRAEFAPELKRLADELVELDPNLVVCLGNTPLWALTGQAGISKLRGTTVLSTHTATGFKCLPTFHPSAVLRQWELRPTVIADLIKASREQGHPEIRRPEREIWIEPTIDDIKEFLNAYVYGPRDRPVLSTDIETAGQLVTCVGFAPSPRVAIVIPFHDPRRKGGSYWPTKESEVEAWTIIRHVLGDRSIPKTFQNGLYDIAFLWRSVGIKVYGAEHDTMLIHHALQPESLKSLGFLGSIYTDEDAWKQQRGKVKTIKRDE